MIANNKDRALHQQGRMFRVPEFLTRYVEEAAAVERRTPGAQLRVLLEEAVEAREMRKSERQMTSLKVVV
jgi:hypothetical protein